MTERTEQTTLRRGGQATPVDCSPYQAEGDIRQEFVSLGWGSHPKKIRKRAKRRSDRRAEGVERVGVYPPPLSLGSVSASDRKPLDKLATLWYNGVTKILYSKRVTEPKSQTNRHSWRWLFFYTRVRVRSGVLDKPDVSGIGHFQKGTKTHLTKRGKSGIIGDTEKRSLWSENAENLEKGEHLGKGLQTESPQRTQRHHKTT